MRLSAWRGPVWKGICSMRHNGILYSRKEVMNKGGRLCGYKETQWLGMYRQSETRATLCNKLELETIEGTHARETPAHQHRPTTLYEVQGSKPSIRALYMQLAKLPHITPHCVPPVRQAQISQHGSHRGRNRYQPNARTTKSEAPGQLRWIVRVSSS